MNIINKNEFFNYDEIKSQLIEAIKNDQLVTIDLLDYFFEINDKSINLFYRNAPEFIEKMAQTSKTFDEDVLDAFLAECIWQLKIKA